MTKILYFDQKREFWRFLSNFTARKQNSMYLTTVLTKISDRVGWNSRNTRKIYLETTLGTFCVSFMYIEYHYNLLYKVLAFWEQRPWINIIGWRKNLKGETKNCEILTKIYRKQMMDNVCQFTYNQCWWQS